MRALGILLALGLWVAPLAAQQLRGRVVLSDSATAAAGVVIEAVLESDAAVRARALSSRSGDYVLQLPRAGAYRLTGLRIGYVPTNFGRISLAAGESRTQQLVMGSIAVQLRVVRVDARAQCGREVEGGSLVADLLSQVRTAVGAATLVSTDGRADAKWRTHRIIVDHESVPLAGPWETEHSGATERPFKSVSLMQLANEGFVRMRDGSVEYRAPDAEVLLSEWFVSTHCFTVVENRDQPELVGLHFVPSQVRAGVTDIRGTLWLAREDAKLQTLEFGYVGLPRYLDAANPGGSIGFAQLADGGWIVRAWELRMPRPVQVYLLATSSRSEGAGPMTVASTEHVGGQVSSVQRTGAELFAAELQPLARRFPALETPERRPSCPSMLAYDADTRGLVYGLVTVREGVLPPSTSVEITWMAPPNRLLPQSERRQTRVVESPDGFFMLCSLPFGSGISIKATATGYVPHSAALRLGSRAPSQRALIVLDRDLTPRRSAQATVREPASAVSPATPQ